MRAAWIDWSTGKGVDPDGRPFKVKRRPRVSELLGALEAAGAPDVVYMTGPARTRVTLRAWALGAGEDLGGWRHGRHYWPDSGAPTLRYENLSRPPGAGVGDVRIMLASTWFGGLEVTPAEGRAALAELAVSLRIRCRGCEVLSTPVQTGLAAMDRLVNVDRTQWSGDYQAEVRASSGQHRVEWCRAGDELAGVHELDMRLAYGALCWQLGAGPPVEYTHWEPWAGARWDLRFTVPADWRRPYGLLPVKDADTGGWHWPTAGTHDTWADGAEVSIALEQGWPCTIYRGIGPSDPKADPLGRWARELVGMVTISEMAGNSFVSAAARACLVQAIGGLVAGPQRVYRYARLEQASAMVPTDVKPGTVRQVGEYVTWAETVPARRPGDLAHPEWAARVYGRCRARLLRGPAQTGVLALDVDNVAGFRGDALYLTCDPRWPYQGKAGEWRTKASLAGPVTIRSLADYDQRTRADA
jgi:hypothetical protein